MFWFRAVWGIAWLLCVSCTTELYRDLSEEDANRVVEELARERIAARKVKTDARRKKYGIEVPDAEASRAISVLSSREVVRSRPEGLSVFLRQQSWLPSFEEQRIRYYVALTGELENTLSLLPGVLLARVHLALPGSTQQLLPENERVVPTRASVMLKVREKDFDLKAEEIQALVAGALVDMPRQEVAVVILPVVARPAPRGPELTWFGPLLVSGRWLWAVILGTLVLFGAFGTVIYLYIQTFRRLKKISPDGTPARTPPVSGADDATSGGNFSGSR